MGGDISSQRLAFLKPSLVVGNSKAWIIPGNNTAIQLDNSYNSLYHMVPVASMSVMSNNLNNANDYGNSLRLLSYNMRFEKVRLATALNITISGIIPDVTIRNENADSNTSSINITLRIYPRGFMDSKYIVEYLVKSIPGTTSSFSGPLIFNEDTFPGIDLSLYGTYTYHNGWFKNNVVVELWILTGGNRHVYTTAPGTEVTVQVNAVY